MRAWETFKDATHCKRFEELVLCQARCALHSSTFTEETSSTVF